MTAPLTIHNAQISTASIEIKTLTISKKQVTLAVFRQLREEPLIADDGTLNGVPWGTVNYHPDKCTPGPQVPDHMHVVWQSGEELRRSLVRTVPFFVRDELYDGNPAAWLDEADRFYAAGIHHWLTTGKPRYWQGGLIELFSGELKSGYHVISATDVHGQRRYVTHEHGDNFTFVNKETDVRVGVEIPEEVKSAVLAEIDRRAAARAVDDADKSREHTDSGYCACTLCRVGKLGTAAAERDAAADALNAWYGRAELDDLYLLYQDALNAEAARRKQYRDAETERRQRHRYVTKALADLPQLFIAV